MFLPTTYNAQPATALKSNTPRRQERAATPLAEGILDQKRKSSCSFRRVAPKFFVPTLRVQVLGKNPEARGQRFEEQKHEIKREGETLTSDPHRPPRRTRDEERGRERREFSSSRERSERLDNALSRLLPTTYNAQSTTDLTAREGILACVSRLAGLRR